MTDFLPRRIGSGYPKVALRAMTLRILHAIYRSLERSRQRRALAELSDARLRDLGLTRHDVRREVAKPFWRR